MRAVPCRASIRIEAFQRVLTYTISCVLVLCVVFCVLLLQPLVYPKLTNRLGIVGTYKLGAWTYLFATAGFSFMTYLVPLGDIVLWSTMVVFRALYVHSATCMFAGSGILLNNSCELHYVSKANAIGQAMASLARAVLPTVAGGIWAFTMTAGWPWQPHAVYMFLFLLNIGAVWNAMRLPLDLNTPKAQLLEQQRAQQQLAQLQRQERA